MRIPAIEGNIKRRILANYRVRPEVIAPLLPDLFQPKLMEGWAIAGICLIRLEQVRPVGLPRLLGISSENAAHRIAVTWPGENGTLEEGVYIPRRDTDSCLNALAGGRIFPGVHHHAKFDVNDDGQRISMTVRNRNKPPMVDLSVETAEHLPEQSIFESVVQSSAFFEAGCVGYSARPDSCKLDGLLLQTRDWRVQPLHVHHINAAWFDDESIFPAGSIAFDHALLMRDIPHQWHSKPSKNSRSLSHCTSA